ncbi:RagB/SusD family nutrient uptake outer membrane protein [Chitinophaga parva]|uniref:RagB/SusD family nutrient uptake outer membrane protein n=1 Tax=Chitinophaga parva TaxID=2169414 RepID=A0A2T7BM02_9BACT|nr:RagB/SusD family nutrient uptake outer membrane protein [Chitinophaga parva]PUZ28686.1 RagB/SusD family nutrient uptake outer membrane protein [Chitinophaga parva]
MKKNILLFAIAALGLASCKTDLDLKPFDKLSPSNAFNKEADLQLYTTSFYNIITDANTVIRADGMSDYMAGKEVNTFLLPSYGSTQSSGWTWTQLRNVNYFLEHCGQAQESTETKNHYAGIARFFRAMFYFEKVKRFGNVPWYGHTLAVGDPELYKTQDPRTLVMDSILADLNFACNNIRATKDASCSQITRWVALAYKSRVCLFEGTFRKYEMPDLPDADKWLDAADSAATAVINSKQYSLNTAGDASMNYRNLFINETPNATEVILAYVCNKSLRVFNDANWLFTSATYGNRVSFTKTFIDTYLNIDGSRFTDGTNFDAIPFQEEVKNRDLRLQQTIRMGNYSREGQPAAPDWTYTYTGYQPIKYTLDSKATDGVAENYNSIPLIRYAEVLLNKAEAIAARRPLTADEWNLTIKPLRARAGIQNTGMPTAADPYLVQYFHDSNVPVTEATLLEVRRERGVELALEGFRFNDLVRWGCGHLLTISYKGLYVPAMDTPMDLNGDGKPEVAFVKATPATKVPGVYYFIIDDNQAKLTEGTRGNLIWMDNIPRDWQPYKYVYPVPFSEITINPNLVQTDGWKGK